MKFIIQVTWMQKIFNLQFIWKIQHKKNTSSQLSKINTLDLMSFIGSKMEN